MIDITQSVGLAEKIIALFSEARRYYNKAMMSNNLQEKKKLLELALDANPSRFLLKRINESLEPIKKIEEDNVNMWTLGS